MDETRPARKMNKQKLGSIRDHKTEQDPYEQLGLERLIFFSDAVFAIAITLLALEIRLPAGEDINTDAELFHRLTGMWHEYLAFFISFMVIGTFWIAHHRKFRLIQRYDNHLITLNLLLLMVVAFIPFPTSVISQYAQRTATVFYALTMVLAGFLLIWLWGYASHHNRLVDPNLDAKQRRHQFISPLITTSIFLISIGIAFWSAEIARLSWMLLLLASLFVSQKQTH